MPQSLSVTLSASTRISIEPVGEDFGPQSEVCAVNWFNLKSPWLYRLYTLLATGFVARASGQLCFRGRLIERLEGSADHQREYLLIVRYRQAADFLQMIGNRLFQLVGLLRMAAVRQFCFGFTENIVAGGEHNDAGRLWLVHHFRGGRDRLRGGAPELAAVAERHALKLWFCGLTTARLVYRSGEQETGPAFFMDGILVYAVRSKEQVEQFIRSDCYRAFMDRNDGNSLYLFSGGAG